MVPVPASVTTLSSFGSLVNAKRYGSSEWFSISTVARAAT